MGIVNPGTSVLYTDIPVDVLERIEDVVLPAEASFNRSANSINRSAASLLRFNTTSSIFRAPISVGE